MNMYHQRESNVLLIHNSYLQAGGEDRVFELESRMLESHGHRVFHYQDHNRRVADMGRVQLAMNTLWNRSSYRDVSRILRQSHIDVVHIHNVFPLISPSVYYAAKRAGVPVVQTLHNYRLLCPDARLVRNGHCCEECVGKVFAWPGVRRGCYQENRAATAVTAAMTAAHKLLGTWSGCIDRYVALTEFARQKFIQGGLAGDRIAVKPNFVDPDPGCGDGQGSYALFVGRLAPEKGISTLLTAWTKVRCKMALRIIGDGPLSGEVREAAAANPNIQWMGALPPEAVKQQMRGARFLVCSSVWYESFGMIIVEAFASGLPVIGSNLGAMAELIDHEETGLLFAPGDPEDCARTVDSAAASPRLLEQMRRQARREYEKRYTASRNYQILMSIYDEAKRQSKTPPSLGTHHDYATIQPAGHAVSRSTGLPAQ